MSSLSRESEEGLLNPSAQTRLWWQRYTNGRFSEKSDFDCVKYFPLSHEQKDTNLSLLVAIGPLIFQPDCRLEIIGIPTEEKRKPCERALKIFFMQ